MRHTGKKFEGMLGPNITGNEWTPDVMADAGMAYHANWVHDELPSPLINSSGKTMVALQYSYELNDAPLLMRSHVEGPEYAKMCIAQFDRLCAESDSGGRMMCLPLHPFAIGQPHRIRYLEQIFEHFRQSGKAWFATANQIVSHYVANNYASDLSDSTGGIHE